MSLFTPRQRAVRSLLARALNKWGVPAECIAPLQSITHKQSYSASANSRHAGHSEYKRIVGLGALGLMAATTIVHSKAEELKSEQTSQTGFVSLASKQRTFFKYEKRIREMSTTEKIFEYFASKEEDGSKYMLPQDLLCAVVPTYPSVLSSTERAGALSGERRPTQERMLTSEFFKNFDIDGDGLISYHEFLVLLTLVSIPESDIRTIFEIVDLDGNGVVDAGEFTLVLSLLQNMAHVSGGKSRVGNKLSRNMDDLSRPTGLLTVFFGEAQNKTLSLAQFSQFLHRLHTELVRLEFNHYDVRASGFILGTDCARSMVASAGMARMDALLDKTDFLPPELANARISFTEFQTLHAMHARSHELSVALNFLARLQPSVSPAQFWKAVKTSTGVELPQTLLALISHVFSDGQGGVDTALFVEVYRAKERASQSTSSPPSAWGLQHTFECVKHCIMNPV